MNTRYHAELIMLGFPIPMETRYTVRCRWRPPRDQWQSLGAKWRPVVVEIDHSGSPQSAAIDACLHIIAVQRGKVEALEVRESFTKRYVITNTTFDRSWYGDVVTWAGDVVQMYAVS
jgi:hypothetical protein